MSFSLFEIQRIWDAWPNIRNHQLLRDLFRQHCSSSSSRQDLSITDVFVIPGHVFIAASSKDGARTGRAVLYVFSCIPLSEVQSGDSHMTTACVLELSRQCTQVLDVVDISKEGQQQVCVVQNNGELSTYLYNSFKLTWSLNESYQFVSKASSVVCSCCFMTPPHTTRPNSRILLYCAKSSLPSPSPHAPYEYHVILRRCEVSPGGSFILGQSSVLLESCPLFNLIGFSDGVCLVPSQGPYPQGLLLFWAPDKEHLSNYSMRAYVWNLDTPTPSPYPSSQSPSSPLNFRSVVLCLAGTWSKVVSEPSLVSITCHPVTNQLLCLDSNGQVYSLTVASTGTIKRKALMALSDSNRATSSSDLFKFPPLTSQPQLFVFYSYYGVVVNGDIRLYDSYTGEYLWESNEHEGAGFKFWTMAKSPGCCGLYGNSGMWIIRNQKVSDHAYFLARGLFPVKTNADETTPGDCLEEGQLLAARLCKLWGLHLLATKYALEAAYDLMKQTSAERGTDGSVVGNPFQIPEMPPELISLLDEKSSLQNPALLVALLAEFPVYSGELKKRVERFLTDYQSRTDDEHASDLSTPLNRELVPLFEKYLALSKEEESLLFQKPPEECTSSCVKVAVCELLKKSETMNSSTMDSSVAALCSQLHCLCESHPQQALLGIKDFLGIQSFSQAVDELKSGEWQSQRNWKDIFATQVATRIERSYLKDTTNHVPLFEETCRLLYLSHPEELLTFVNFAQLARDHQAQGDSAFARKCRKDFFFHRALNALPKMTSVQDTPTNAGAVRAYCQLLLSSDQGNCEMLAVQLLMENGLWEDVIGLVEQASKESRCFLFHALLNGLSKGGVLNLYLDRAWQMLPDNFNAFDFLNILKNGSSAGGHVVVSDEDSTQLKISSITPKLLILLEQAAKLVGQV